MKKNSTIILVMTLCIGGCSPLLQPSPVIQKLQNDTIVSTTSDLSMTKILQNNSQMYSCTSPPPDTAFSQIDDSSVSFSILGRAETGGNEEGSASTELIGRTPAVLLSRELFFRACEFSKNQNLTKEEAKKVFSDTLSLIGQGWLAEAQNTTVTIGDTLANSNTESTSLGITAATTTTEETQTTADSTD